MTPFQDLPEGQTHSFDDGCGMPEHNLPMTNPTEQEPEYNIKDEVGLKFTDAWWYATNSRNDVRRNAIRSLLSTERQKHQEEIEKVLALVQTHTEHEGGYCDTGEDMEWACRSECVDMAIKRVREYLNYPIKEAKE